MSYTAQATLTDKAPMILDATCSDKKIWPRSATLRLDIRRDVGPDIVASAAYLPFRDGIFAEVYCDPPHMIRNDLSEEKFQAYLNQKWKSHPRLIREKSGYIRIRDPGQKPRGADLLRFGAWKTREEWLAFVKGTNEEFARALKPGGQLHYKLASGQDKRMVKIEDLEQMSNFQETRRQTAKSRAPWSPNTTYWLTLKPKEAVA